MAFMIEMIMRSTPPAMRSIARATNSNLMLWRALLHFVFMKQARWPGREDMSNGGNRIAKQEKQENNHEPDIPPLHVPIPKRRPNSCIAIASNAFQIGSVLVCKRNMR